MTPSSPQHEPTMEEILASIRKIISEDSSENQPPKQEADVLELTQEVAEEPASVATAPSEPQPEASVVSMSEANVVSMPETNVVSIAPPAPQPEASAAPAENEIVFVSNEEAIVSAPVQEPEDDSIFSEKSRQAIDDAFASLDEAEEEAPSQPAATPMVPTVNGNSVEAVFERAVSSSVEPLLHQWMDGRKDDLMAAVKPMIRDWMDEHFPALLEGAVREEVARVIKARGRR